MKTHIIGKIALFMGAAVLLSTTKSQAQMESGLLNYWPLDGTADDLGATSIIPGVSGTSINNGQINGNVSFVDAATEGLGAGFGQAGNFPGVVGDNITIPDPDALTNDIDRSGADLSISVWIKANQWSAGWQAIVSHGEGADYRIARRAANDPVLLAYAGGTGDIQSNTTYGAAPDGDGLWHHIVATTATGGVTQLYVNGTLEATSAGVPTIGSNTERLCIGCNPAVNGREFNGLIDDIAMWDRVLTTEEITSVYDAGIAGNALSTLLPAPEDSDNDGLPDAWETFYGLDPNDDGTGDINNGPTGDLDSDNVDNLTEFNNGTFPNDDDSDDDTLTDDIETNSDTFVNAANTGTDPLNPDSDGDGLSDSVEDGGNAFVSETQTGSDPNVADTDADTMPDNYEVDNMLDPNTDDGSLDPDTDDLDNLTEFGLGTNPQLPDTDDDGLSDGAEVNTHSTDPLVADSDGDSLSDGEEINDHMTDPNLTDSDEDLFSDAQEIDLGSDPNDANSTPGVEDLPEPLLYYSFDVEDGTIAENLGSLATAGTLVGGATYADSLDPSYGTAFSGNRATDNDGYVQTGFTGTELGFGPDSVYTAMAWIRWSGESGNLDHMVFGQEDGAGNNSQLHHGIRVDTTAPNVHYGGWANDIGDAGTVVAETWSHVAWQYDGADKVVFVNGVETARGAGNTMAGHTLPVIIGGHGRDAENPAGQSFNGLIDEVKIYGNILTSAQIAAAMLPGEGAGAAGLEVRSISYNDDDDTVTLRFTSRPGRSYTLLWTPDFMDRPEYDEIEDGIDADAVEDITTYTFPTPRPGGVLAPKAFFFVRQNE